MVLHHSGLKTGIDFAHIGLESTMVFKGTTRVYKRIVRLRKTKIILYVYIFFVAALI